MKTRWTGEWSSRRYSPSGGGFDIAIANPPYVSSYRAMRACWQTRYENVGYSHLGTRTGDVYQLFYERGCQALNPANGLVGVHHVQQLAEGGIR